jgi:CRP-like cAMP-binding protein
MDESDENGVVQLKMNREELADYLGVARPSLSRALMRMQKEEMIEVDRCRIKILNYEKIENFCN